MKKKKKDHSSLAHTDPSRADMMLWAKSLWQNIPLNLISYHNIIVIGNNPFKHSIAPHTFMENETHNMNNIHTVS